MRAQRRLLRGNYNPLPKQRKYPNLQWAKVQGERARVCTTCLKTLNKRGEVALVKKA
ncbi:MAG: hypothetical protein KGZ30_04250 [Anaplasmataceae bacterium]|nr:hypothetical protein [Anaplasmataceae bacterium]